MRAAFGSRHDVGVSRDESGGSVVAAVVGTLSPGDVGKPFSDADRVRAMVPHAWQMRGAQYEWAEIHGVSMGLPHGFFADLLCRAAAAGEQLGLAFAALRDADVWRDNATEQASTSHRNIAGRAIAEASGLWAVSAWHAVANVVARVVRIHDRGAGLDKKLRWSGLPVPFDSGRSANLSLNAETVTRIMAVARQTGESTLVEFVAPLDALTNDPSWAAIVARRDAGYHRIRPQSIAGGVPPGNPWAADQSSGGLTLSVSTFKRYFPPVLEDVVAETQAGYDALSAAMREINDRLPAALRAAGFALWPIS